MPKEFLTSCMMRRRQLGSICPYLDLLFPIRDARTGLRSNYVVVRKPMIGARVPLGGQLISCKNMVILG
jgi:hypothetical protein